MILALLILVVLLLSVAVALIAMAYVKYTVESPGSQAETHEEEDEVDEPIEIPLELRSPFAIGDAVHVGNPHTGEYQFYYDSEREKPVVHVVERAVYDGSEELFRYKLEGLPGFYSQGWLAPCFFGAEVKEYPELDEEVDESLTEEDYSKEVDLALESKRIDWALDTLNSDASEEEKEYARKVLRGESE